MRYVYMCRAAHFASKLPSFVLDVYSQVVSVGQVVQNRYLVDKNQPCACGEPMANCWFWREPGRAAEPVPSVPIDAGRLY